MKGLQRIRIYDSETGAKYRDGADHWLLEDASMSFFMVLTRPEAPTGHSFTHDLKAEIYAMDKQLYFYEEAIF